VKTLRSTSFSARRRFVIAALAGILAAAITVVLQQPALAAIVGWDVAATCLLLWEWFSLGHLDAAHTREVAMAEDPTRESTDLLVLSASVISLAAVGVVIGKSHSASGAHEFALAVLAIFSVAVSWALVHTLYTLRYARLYYRGGTAKGISFNQDEPPRYLDFAYLAFTLGMTFQVSDTDLQTSEIRATALRHALLSYLFGAVILATTINLVAGLASGT
jgi:uncharacterized membrane protein